MKEEERLDVLGKIFHDQIVAEQAAWIEWKHGRGAEAAMQWIENGLDGPGHIPGEDEPYSKDAQLWFNANKSDPFPLCFCGNPSGQLWMGKGACCDEHMEMTQKSRDLPLIYLAKAEGRKP